jgi:HD-GYP domain-containing protein (c-di-GMP phosphodiesterase class II)
MKALKKIKDIYGEVSRFNKLDIQGIEDIIMGFTTVLQQDIDVLRTLSPIKAHSSYTSVHETNVSMLTIFQAESLGLTGEALHEAGLAGLLHDVGKMFVPKKIIDKQGKLDEHELGIIQLHPVYGALYLSTQPDVSKTAVIAAYEHHMRYDGSGYPQNKKTMKRQHKISQLVAIADFFDALRTKRSYRSSFNLIEVLKIIKEGTGTYFNPELIDNFLSVFHKVRTV